MGTDFLSPIPFFPEVRQEGEGCISQHPPKTPRRVDKSTGQVDELLLKSSHLSAIEIVKPAGRWIVHNSTAPQKNIQL